MTHTPHGLLTTHQAYSPDVEDSARPKENGVKVTSGEASFDDLDPYEGFQANLEHIDPHADVSIGVSL